MKKTRQHLNKRKKIILVVMIIVLVFLMIGYAWYLYLTKRKAATDNQKVMAPYYLYLVNAADSDYLNLTVGNLHPGETKQVVIGVTNQDPKGQEVGYSVGKESSFQYELELAYTKNLPINYKVYELTKLTDTTNLPDDAIAVKETDAAGEVQTVGYFQKKKNNDTDTPLVKEADQSETINHEMYGDVIPDSVKNLGQYDLYQKGVDGLTKLSLMTTVSENVVNYDLDYYMIQIDWKDNIQFEDVKKETDLVYVIVNALQPKPEER